MTKRKWNTRTTMILAVAVALVLGYQALAMWQSVATRPSNIVWIDIERVFENLNARMRADQELNDRAESFDGTAQDKRKRIESMKEELEILAEGSDAYKQAEERLLQMTYEYSGYLEFAKQKLERRKAKILGEIYAQIRQGAQEIGQQHGFDYVIVNDSLGSLAAATTEAEMNRQISARRMLFATAEFDATDLLIEHMNSN